MCDKLLVSREKVKKFQLGTTVSRRTIVRKLKRSSKSFKRRNRRKRSKKSYLNMLKSERNMRNTEELCSSIQECSVMDVEAANDLSELPKEVADWQKHEQLVYWKSRAISLEIENRMLRQHLRNVYTQHIDYYEENIDCQQSLTKLEPVCKSSNESKPNEDATPTFVQSCKSKVLPKEPEGKDRLKKMEKIYGNKAPKIMGMETAIELNYEKLVEEGCAGYWPNLPLKL